MQQIKYITGAITASIEDILGTLEFVKHTTNTKFAYIDATITGSDKKILEEAGYSVDGHKVSW